MPMGCLNQPCHVPLALKEAVFRVVMAYVVSCSRAARRFRDFRLLGSVAFGDRLLRVVERKAKSSSLICE